jgi:hypothetical protein
MHKYRRMILAAVAITALIATPAFAQGTQVNSGFGIGALGGINWTSVKTETNDFEIDTNTGTGWQLGIWFGGNRDGRAGLMGEISYGTKKVKLINPVGTGDIVAENTYVQIPVLLRINTGARERDKPSLYFLVGPVFDIKIKSNEEFTDLFTDPDEVYEGLEIGLMVGAGFEVVRIGIEGRYSWGLRNVLGTDAANNSGFGSTKFNTLSLVAKIRFN